MATTTSDEGFHEIQLNGKQLVFLFMAVTVVSVVIFLCGVLVGRGVRGDAATGETMAAEQSEPIGADVPAVAAAPSGAGSATANEDLSYPDRLAKSEMPREQLRETPPPAPTPAPAPAAPPAAPAPTTNAPVTPAEPVGAGFAIQLAALSQRDEAQGIARRLTGKGYPAYVLAPDAGAPAVFRVRVGKFKDRREAETVKTRLEKEEQFKPWIVR
ncbi:MAG TPA: SPOR domain-containing protein [Vicinamibacterales bacterium]|nr:SPOR domain-containing protein [Vicinamibacterales bacterium]